MKLQLVSMGQCIGYYRNYFVVQCMKCYIKWKMKPGRRREKTQQDKGGQINGYCYYLMSYPFRCFMAVGGFLRRSLVRTLAVEGLQTFGAFIEISWNCHCREFLRRFSVRFYIAMITAGIFLPCGACGQSRL